MQTFLPYASFRESAKCLDNKRLGKQRVEAQQILNALNRNEGGWLNHPAVKMWRGHEKALKQYLHCVILEWVNRGFANSIVIPLEEAYELPSWLTKEFIDSHRSNLLRKDSEWYGKYKWEVESNLPYVWPVN